MSFLARLLGRFFGRGLRREVDECLGMVRMGVGLRLIKKYGPQYGKEEASTLAAAVTNALFGAKPSTDLGREFIASNGELVEAKLGELKSEKEICYMVSLASHTLANIAGGTASLTSDMIQTWDKLTKLGIMLPIEKIQMPKSIDELRTRAREFMQQAN